MKIYIDNQFRCRTANPDGTLREIQTDVFDGKCSAYIEGMRYIPPDETWRREDGRIFTGEMRTPWKPYAELEAAQAQYEADLAQLQAAYQEGVNSI